MNINESHDEAFETRVSADVKYHFGGPSKTIYKKTVAEMPLIKALSTSPIRRNVRVHDKAIKFDQSAFVKRWEGLCKFYIDTVTNDAWNRKAYAQGENLYGLNETFTAREFTPRNVKMGIYRNDSFVCEYDQNTGKGGLRYFSDVVQVKG